MKDTSTILYTFEDTSGDAETFTDAEFHKILEKEKQLGSLLIQLKGEDDSIQVPILEGYKTPYDYTIVDDEGTEHFIYYEEGSVTSIEHGDSLLLNMDNLNQMDLECMKKSVDFFKDPKKVSDYKKMTESNMKDISDGYHTFEDLYMHRRVLSSIIFSMFPQYAWKSWKHEDGTMFDDSFITGVSIPGVGDYSYHYHNEFWDEFDVQEVEFAPVYDGHKPEDIGRLKELLKLK